MCRKISLSLCVLLLCLAMGPSTRSLAAAADPITEWGLAASAAAAAAGMAPLRTPVTLALLQVAMFDAVTAITGNRRPDAVARPVIVSASPYAAAVEAGYRVLLAEFPDQQSQLRLAYEKLVAGERNSSRKRIGIEIGAEVARRLRWTSNPRRASRQRHSPPLRTA